MKSYIINIVAIGFLVFFTACSGGGGSSSSTTTDPVVDPVQTTYKTISGTIVDGLIKDASVCLDINSNNQCDTDEPTTISADDGSYSLQVDTTLSGRYKVISIGGVDTATNQNFDGILEDIVEVAEADTALTSTVTPLTTMASKMYDQEVSSDSTFTPTKAKEKLATSLGLTTAQISANPLEDKVLFAKTQMIVQATRLLTTTIQKDTTSRTINQEVFNTVLTQVVLSLSDTTQATDINISKIVIGLKADDANISIPTDVEIFIQSYADEVESKINETTDISDLTSIQNGLETYVAEITAIIQTSTTLGDDLATTLASVEQTSTATIVEIAQSSKSQLVRSVVVPRGDTNNTYVAEECGDLGGIAVYSGIDSNNDGILGTGEQNEIPQVVCNGSDGANGFTSLIDTVVLNIGDVNCPEGGVTINFGIDLNTNATLDIETELTQSINLCNAADGIDGATGADGTSTTSDAVFSQTGTLKGSIPADDIPTLSPSRSLRTVTSMTGGLWLTPSAIEAAIAEDKKATATAESTTVPEPIVEPIPITVEADGTYEVANLPSNNDYALVYINAAGKSAKLENITITPGSIIVQDIVTADLANPGSIQLNVQALEGGSNLADSVVRLNELDKNVTTTADGVAEFTNIPVGTYSITVSKDDYVSKYFTVIVTSDNTTAVGAVELTNVKGRLAGRVSASDVDDYSNIIVYAKGIDGSVYTTFTSASGNYLFNALPVGSSYSVIAYAHDYQSDKVDGINVLNDYVTTANTINLIKYPTTYLSVDEASISVGSISGYARFSDVTDSLNHAGIIVSVEGTDYEAITSRDGSFILNNIPEGDYTLNFTDSNHNTVTEATSVISGSTTHLLDIELSANVGTVVGKVVDSDNVALNGVDIIVVSERNTYSTVTSGSGDFSLPVTVGTYTVTAILSGYGTAQSSGVDILYNTSNTSLQTTPLELVSHSIIGSIDVEGSVDNFTGVTIQLTNLQNSAVSNAVLNVDGSFSINAIENGNYKLEISHTNTDYKTTTLELYNVDDDGYIFTAPILVEKKEIAKDDDMLTFDYIRGQNADANSLQYNLILPISMPNGSSVSWASDNTALVTNSGVVSLPLSTESNTLNLEATVSYGTEVDRVKSIALTVVKDYQPVMSATASVTVDEDFGYLVKDVTAVNLNNEEITYSITNEVNLNLVETLTIDSTTGQISVKSKENMNGVVTFDVVASSGTPTLTDTKSLTLNISPVADSVTANAGEDQTISPSTEVTLDSSASTDIDGDATYDWVLTKPAGSTSVLSNATVENPTFTPDVTGTYTATLTLENSDGTSVSVDSMSCSVLPVMSVSNITVTEGNDAVFTVNVTAHDNEVTLDYTTDDITAVVFKDYQKISGTLTFASGELSKTITVPVTVDHLPEATEEFKVQLSNISGAIQNTIEAIASISYAPLDLFYLTGINGFVIEGLEGSKDYSTEISSIGDYNSDGIDDIIIGSSKESSNGDYSGVSRILFGSETIGEYGSYDVSTIASGKGFKVFGNSQVDYSGYSTAYAGNFGFENSLVIGAHNEDPLSRSNAGSVYVINSSVSTDIDDNSTGLTDGYKIHGASAGDYLGTIVSSAGDFNGDGIQDILINASGGTEKTYLIYGTGGYSSGDIDLSLDIGTKGIVITGAITSMSNAGDINGDGFDDIILGDYTAGTSYAGKSYIIYGDSNVTNAITLSSLGVLGTTVSGLTYYRTGYSVNSIGDVNADGYADVIIGTMLQDKSYVIFGSNDIHTNSTISLTSITSYGFIIYDSGDNDSGKSVSGNVDINGDGISDIVVSGTKGGVNSAGKVYVVYGDKNLGSSGTQFNLADIDGSNGFEINGINSNEKAGLNVVSAKDFNGDGFDDILLSTYLGLKAYVILGGDYTNEVTQKVLTGKIGTGSSDVDVMIGSSGSEVLQGNGGADVLKGGPGEDVIYVSDLDFLKVDGGNSLDILYLDFDGADINLSSVKPEQIKNIESINISGTGPNTLIMDDVTIKNLKNSSYNSMLYIMGDADDKIILSDEGWIFTGTLGGRNYTKDGITFTIDDNLGTLPEIVLSSNIEVMEDSETAKIAIRRSNGLYTSTINYSLISGSAVAGVDYIDSTGTVTFYEGELIKDFTFTMIQDDKLEELKSLTLYLDSPQNFDLPTGNTSTTISIKDDVIGLEYLNGTNGMKIHPESSYNRIGYSVSNAGDINGDGYDDMALSSQYYKAYIVFGNNSGENISDFSLSDLNSSNGLKMTGFTSLTVSNVGDVNGDGYDDIVAGDYNDEKIYLVFGKQTLGTDGALDLSEVNTSNRIEITGTAISDYTGYSVSGAGDMNGDGYDDILVGAYMTDSDGGVDSGESYVIFGKSSWSDTSLSTLDGSNGFKMTGIASGDRSGSSVSKAGDFNADGYDDVIIGARYGDTYGEAYVVLGASDVGSSGTIALSSLTSSTEGILIASSDIAYAYQLGSSVSGGGDINGDGYDDVIVGASNTHANSLLVSGKSIIIYGNTSTTDIDVSTINGTNGFIVNGAFEYGYLGSTVENAGDINGDGYDDILLNAMTSYSDSSEDAVVYALYGGVITSAEYNLSDLNTSVGFSIESSARAYFGRALGGVGDYNGDGFSDMFIGAYYEGTTYDYGGEVYLINGRDFLGRATYVGTSGNDSKVLYNTTLYYFYPKQGDDYVYYYNAPDIVLGGQGDDEIKGYGWPNDTIGKILGGKGFDTLSFAYGTSSLDFTSFSDNKAYGFEKIDLSFASTNYTLTMSTLDILHMLDTDQHTFYIDGDAGDAVVITDGTWTENLSDGDATYRTWSMSNSPIVLKIEEIIGTITVP